MPVSLAQKCGALVDSKGFNLSIIALIVLNGVVVGCETSTKLDAQYGALFDFVNQTILLVFIGEALLKLLARGLLGYFKSGWNIFDFTIIVVSLLPIAGSMATVARLVRLLRVLRLVSAFPELRLLVDTLTRSIPSMGHISILMGLIFYIFGVAGVFLFRDIDPEHWRHLGIALLSLFRIVTFEDWTDIMYTSMEVYPYAWLYYVAFVVMGAFVMINLFIGVVLNNLDEAKTRRLEELQAAPSKQEILRELRQTQEALARLQRRLED